MKPFFQNNVLFRCTIIAFTVFFGSISTPYAQDRGYGCDHDIWAAMVNQAALETRRQDMTNKRYIVKADSVLQYSCFSDEVENTILNVGPIFSNGDQWVGAEVDITGNNLTATGLLTAVASNPTTAGLITTAAEALSNYTTTVDIYNPDSLTEHGTPETDDGFDVRVADGHNYKPDYFMDALTPLTLEEALTEAVLEPYEAYIDGQFNHLVLSGTTPLVRPIPSLCHPMAEVWQAAKCKNFDGVNVFYRLEELVTFDPREFPPSMPCSAL